MITLFREGDAINLLKFSNLRPSSYVSCEQLVSPTLPERETTSSNRGKQNFISHLISDGNGLLCTMIESRVSGALKMATEVMWARNVKLVSRAL